MDSAQELGFIANTDTENVKRAVRYLREWLPVAARSLGIQAHQDVQTLMQFAYEQLGDVEPQQEEKL